MKLLPASPVMTSPWLVPMMFSMDVRVCVPGAGRAAVAQVDADGGRDSRVVGSIAAEAAVVGVVAGGGDNPVVHVGLATTNR